MATSALDRTSTAAPARVSLRAVTALFLERQHLDRPRQRRLNPKRLAAFALDAGGIQLDTINVIERAHYLTLWSRFGPYDKKALDRLVYRKRLLFEYWAHAACLVPTAHFDHWRFVMNSYAQRPRYRGWADWARKNEGVVREVEQAIRESGPMSNADFEHPRPGTSGGWWDWKPAAHALDYLWMCGKTLVHSRSNFQKRYDLAERVFPEGAGGRVLDEAEFRRWHLRQSLHAMGAATETDLRMYLTFPPFPFGERKRALAEMRAAGEVVEIEVTGRTGSRWFALAEDLPALARASRKRPRGTTLLSPFDSLLWYRDRVRRLFGFDYKIQVYTPQAQRRHGYYLLPIYHAGQLIGRLDAKTHRAERRLEVKAVHFEPWFAAGAPPPAASWGEVDRDEAIVGLSAALGSLARFVGADRITVGPVRPVRLQAPLRRAVVAVAT